MDRIRETLTKETRTRRRASLQKGRRCLFRRATLEARARLPRRLSWPKRLKRQRPMFGTIYIAVMLGVIGLMTALAIPSLFWKKCRACGAKNGLDAEVCKRCNAPFPRDGKDV